MALRRASRSRSSIAVFEQISQDEKSTNRRQALQLRQPTKRSSRNSNAYSDSDTLNDVEQDQVEQDEASLRASKRHIRYSEEPLNMRCDWDDCEMRFDKEHSFQRHLVIHADDMPNDLRCKWTGCDYVATTKPDFKRHVSQHGYYCKLVNIGFNQVGRNKLPPCSEPAVKWEEICRDLSCRWGDCDQVMTTFFELLIHIRMHVNCYPNRPPKGEFLSCEWTGCSSKCTTSYKLTDHMRVHSGEKCLACPVCNSMFASNTKFLDHRKRQLPVEMQSYECSQCSKLFPTERLLRDHTRSHINHYKCNQCDMTCPKPSILAKHIRHRHLEERPFSCNLCDYRSVTKYALESHLTTHCPGDLIICAKCDFSCRSMNGIETHMLEVHKMGKRKVFACHCCKERFSRGHDLTKHLMKRHGFKWPSGHSRFRFKENEDGVYRLQTVRYETLEVTEEMIKSSSERLPPENSDESADELESKSVLNYVLEQKPLANTEVVSFVLRPASDAKEQVDGAIQQDFYVDQESATAVEPIYALPDLKAEPESDVEAKAENLSKKRKREVFSKKVKLGRNNKKNAKTYRRHNV